ncbi:MAG: HYR domain-containing protein [Acidobacteria bacterium]|nr:HYR domain-containing protein [Acidobacteriota bacterium]
MSFFLLVAFFAATLPAAFAAGSASPRSTRLTPATRQAGTRASKSDPSSDSSKGKESPEDAKSELETIPVGEYHRRPGGTIDPSRYPSTTLDEEVEPNGTAATATPIAGTSARIRGTVPTLGDFDYYSFTGTAGDSVYAAVATSFSSNGSTDSVLDLFQPDGTTVIESDDNDGSFGALSSSIAGATLAASGTHYLRVRHFSATGQLRPYDLYFQLRSGSPTLETEPNDVFPGQPIPPSGWISGYGGSLDIDSFAVTLAAGDTVFLSLDADPERDFLSWNPRLGLGAFDSTILLVNDASGASPNSEAFFYTVKDAGTYGIYIDSAINPGTYRLSVTVFPRVSPGTCTTYTSTNVPATIPTGPGFVTSTLTVPGNPRIDKLRVNISLNHAYIQDVDVDLTSPDGSTIVLFTDVGPGGPATMDLTLDDDAAVPVSSYTILSGMAVQPEREYRLGWREGTLAGGTWTLTVRDDVSSDGGTLTGWSIEICEDTTTFCGGPSTVVYSSDFETDGGGFTHSGAGDEWERGLPTFAPVTGANSGTNAWKTDLDNTYEANSTTVLLSPNIVLPASGPIQLSWAQKYQFETATFDRGQVYIREVGVPGNFRLLWEHLEADMIASVGSGPLVTIQQVAGWQLCKADISDFAGLTVEVFFGLSSDTTVQRAGWAIDDVLVEACVSSCTITCPANVTQANDTNQCGAVVNYPAPTATGSCGPITCTPASGAFFPIGTTTVTCTDGGMGSCTFTVTVNDTQAPTITCPANVTQSNDAGQCSAVVNYTAPVIADNCPGVTAVCTPASGSTFPVGVTSVTCTATDAAANTASCSFSVTVNDTQAPTITCPADITTTGTVLNGCTLSAVVNYPAPVVTDNCPGVGAAVCTPASGSTFPEGTTVVTCNVSDAAGNAASCTFNVTVGTAGAFGACAIDDYTGDTWSIVTDPMSPNYGYWRYTVAATSEVICGTASSVSYTPGVRLVASDNDDPRFSMNANLNFGSNSGTVQVNDRSPRRKFVVRDRKLSNNVCP